jgi:hypothetical protein
VVEAMLVEVSELALLLEVVGEVALGGVES